MKNIVTRSQGASLCPTRLVLTLLFLLLLGNLPLQNAQAQAFVHPGLLSSNADFSRMRAEVALGAHPWIDSYDMLIANPDASLSYTDHPVSHVIRGSANGTDNYWYLMDDISAAYADSLNWRMTGNTAYADKAVQICNDWSAVLTAVDSNGGDSDGVIAAGIYGYEFANVAENMRSYTGWGASPDFTRFQNMMLDVFYPTSHAFLLNHNGAGQDAYFASWDELSYANIMAIGVLCDNRSLYNEALADFKSPILCGGIAQAVYQIFPGLFGQLQESGRDQGHSGLNMSLLGAVCQMAWNQGDDLYSYDNNRFLSGAEYFAKYNLGSAVPFVNYTNCQNVVMSAVSSNSRGDVRPAWALIYNHYANLEGVAAPYTKQYCAYVGIEGGGGDYGPNSGGYDQLGYTTLTCTLPSFQLLTAPSGLKASVTGPAVTLSWWGSTNATGYNVERSKSSGGPYADIASDISATTYTDSSTVVGVRYYYVVTSVGPSSNSADSNQVEAIPNTQLTETMIGTPGSINSDGNTMANAFDSCLRSPNYVDGPDASYDWLGLDLGSQTSYIVNEVKVCPRAHFSGRMVGGIIQGSDTANFSSGVVNLYTIASAPADNQSFTTIMLQNSVPFRYVRYLSPANSYRNLSEIEFYGYPVVKTAIRSYRRF